MINDNRLGRFHLSRQMIEDNPGFVRQVMAKIIVVKAELMWATNNIEYVAICDDFKPISGGVIVPEYIAIFHSEKGFQGWEIVE